MLLKHHVEVPDDFTRSIRDVVVPIRNSMKIVKNKFDGSFKNECQKDSVPIELLVLISMLVDGVGIENQGFSQEALTISQLVMYNFSNRKIRCNGFVRFKYEDNEDRPLQINHFDELNDLFHEYYEDE